MPRLPFLNATSSLHLRAARALAATLLVLGSAGTALADQDEDDGDEGGSYAIGLWGDLPYDIVGTDAQTKLGVPNLIADMNLHRLRFTAHDGDLKGGSGPVTCSDSLYTNALAFFGSLRAPAIFTPGDNDWTDCDRVANGAFNSRNRLDQERKVLFATPYTLGQRRLRQQVQTEALCLNEAGQKVPCVENRRWSVGGVMYATLNVPGSCNNLCDIAPDLAEYSARNVANIKWLQQTFAAAKERNSKAVMLITQANPGWDLTDGTRAPLRDPKTLAQTDGQPDGYKDYLLALRDEVIAFRKPVAYVHGDSHYYRVDKPLLDGSGRRLENFTRVETFGDNVSAVNLTNDVQWIKVTVTPHSREVFSYQAMIVPGNRVAVPAP